VPKKIRFTPSRQAAKIGIKPQGNGLTTESTEDTETTRLTGRSSASTRFEPPPCSPWLKEDAAAYFFVSDFTYSETQASTVSRSGQGLSVYSMPTVSSAASGKGKARSPLGNG
jgi:hypothetical protein